MESLALLPALEELTAAPVRGPLAVADVLGAMDHMKAEQFSIETAIGAESVLQALFDWRNVPDDLGEAYEKAFTASGTSLYEHYGDIVERGESSLRGFVSTLKGKLAEVRLEPQLEEWFPGYDFELAADPTQGIWDLKGVSLENAGDIFVQVKMQAVSAAGDVVERMQDNSNVLFAVSHELYEKILDQHPELIGQLLDTEVLDSGFTASVSDNLEILAENFGIDLPDGVGDFLPYIGEIILGIRLVLDVIAVERDFKTVRIQDRSKLHALKALVLLSRFGVSAVCTTVGGAAGSAAMPVPGLGTTIGALGGVGLAVYLNRKLMPRLVDVATRIMDLTQDDMFYFRNRATIDGLALSFVKTGVA